MLHELPPIEELRLSLLCPLGLDVIDRDLRRVVELLVLSFPLLALAQVSIFNIEGLSEGI